MIRTPKIIKNQNSWIQNIALLLAPVIGLIPILFADLDGSRHNSGCFFYVLIFYKVINNPLSQNLDVWDQNRISVRPNPGVSFPQQRVRFCTQNRAWHNRVRKIQYRQLWDFE